MSAALPGVALKCSVSRRKEAEKPETGNQRRENPGKRRERGKTSPTSPPSYTRIYAAAVMKGKTYAYWKKKASSSLYGL
ncbi:hypothetical protein E2C01_100290 [Portunus trituberculatus]|uniref:Uncharacterized protein n=1 Tax=Portunus trituberculatus TaxID=210409 RepID=A0A5B7KCZ1_PORTR|nr:hypothetical protein [Portunus trituberculatus]